MEELQEALEGGWKGTFTSSGGDFSLSNTAGSRVVSSHVKPPHFTWLPAGDLAHSRPTAGQAYSSICAFKWTQVC